ncbi:hypothetical protein MKK84_09075 [Methylobacterium sp. E-065]|uniref:hypothetical protein n=1 Tax=Methylobacterium sp. E-065 TaxID=2836583 RepID=UPI001FB9DA7E|nr:hypothetical protein [Methylobacterium sp. E-065]MCJ2017569.1 hypothetical protein [Methylobacterium sp. E-065]
MAQTVSGFWDLHPFTDDILRQLNLVRAEQSDDQANAGATEFGSTLVQHGVGSQLGGEIPHHGQRAGLRVLISMPIIRLAPMSGTGSSVLNATGR